MLFTFLKRLLPATQIGDGAGFPEAYRLYEEGRLDEAAAACEALRGVAPADKYFLVGLIHEKRGELAAAAAAMRTAVEARPAEPSFRYGLAKVLGTLGQRETALAETERFLALSTADDPRRASACVAAAGWSDADERAEAAWLERALAVDSSAGTVLVADALYQRSHVEPAREALAKNARIDSYALQLRRAMMLPAIYDSRGDIDATRARLEHELDSLLLRPAERSAAPESEIGIVPFYLAYHHANNVELLEKTRAVMRRAHPASASTARPCGSRSEHQRVGFVSTFFYSHSIGRITIGLIRDLPRERFDVHVFAIEPHDDPLRREIEDAAGVYVRLPGSLSAVREALLRADLDVLVFADIGMHPLTYFLALERFAPLQLVWWGHPETTGIDTIDYYLCARGIAPGEMAPLYRERLLRPNAFFLPGYARPAAATRIERDTLGLPTGRRLYACLQPLFKLHPDIDAVLLDILERDPQAAIVLLESNRAWARQIRRRFARTLGTKANRVYMLGPMPHARFLATLAAADVVLDPLYFGGGNSSCEAFAAGVPVVTLPGTHLYGRLTAALCAEMRIDECVVGSAAEYAERAMQFAMDREFRKSVTERIDERCDLLFERKDFTLAFAEMLSGGVSGLEADGENAR